MKITASDILIIVDLQNDFCPQGSLAVPEGDEIVAIVNDLIPQFTHVVLTQDWHPPHHSSFASQHQGKAPFEEITLPYGPQTLWPDHCIMGSKGAAFHANLNLTPAELIIRKGFRADIDSYSAFFENDHLTPTGLNGYLKERGFERVFLTGLAFDYCVRYSAEDAQILGFETFVYEKACRAIGLGNSVEATCQSFADRGIRLI